MAEAVGARALLEPKCGGTEDPEYQTVPLEKKGPSAKSD
jgi:hypothetical protein